MTIVRPLSRNVSAYILLALLALAPFAAAQTTNVTGFWRLRIPRGDGTFGESYFDLKQDGAAITGQLIQGSRKSTVSEGTLADGKLHLVVTVRRGNPPQEAKLNYEGTLNGDKFDLTPPTFGNRPPVTGVLERSTPEAAQPPKPYTLPELHEVRDNGLARTPPMGWNSWNKFAGRVTDADVRGMADAMVSSGMKDAGYIYINIDDTWEGQSRDAQGNITTNTKFPDMKALADYVHSKGLKIGIYSGPGNKTCAGYEGSFGHEEQDAAQYAKWGIDYLKYDWCSATEIWPNADANTMRAVYQKMGDALLKTGRPIVYSLCEYGWQNVWEWGPKVGGNLWRTTGDISDRWQSLDRIGFGNAVWGATPETRKRQLDIASFTQVGHWNDPDMLEIGNGGMTGDEYRTHMSLWSLLAAPLLAGNDLRTMTDEIKSILMNKEVIAIDQDPAGKPPKPIGAYDGTAVVITRQLKDGSVAIGLFNRGDAAQDVKVSWSDVGLAGKKLSGRDLWKHADVALTGDSFSANVLPHAVVLLKVTGK